MLETLHIPDDLEACQQLVRELMQAYSQLERVNQELLEMCANIEDSQQKLKQERDELQLTIKRLMHQLYGRRSERWKEGEGQKHLDFGDVDTTVVDMSIVSAVNEEDVVTEHVVRRHRGPKRPRNEQLPEHLERRPERVEPTLPPGVKIEDCAWIGMDVVEVLEFDRAKMWVRRIEYPKYKLPGLVQATLVGAGVQVQAGEGMIAAQDAGAVQEVSVEYALESGREAEEDRGVCAAHVLNAEHGNGMSGQLESSGEQGISSKTPVSAETAALAPAVPPHGILQAPREVTLIPGGRFGFGVATEVLFSKFVLHVPLYRQQDMWAQSGWSPSRSTLGQIVTVSASLFLPLAERMRQLILATAVLGTDDTPVTLLTPGVGGGSREARFWLYRGRDAAPYNVFAFTDSRAREGPDRFLETFHGIITGDCYSGYVNIEKVTRGRIRFSACLAHARRKIFESREQQPALSSQILALMGELYDVEDRARTLDDVGRLTLRQKESVPAMARLRAVLDGEAAKKVLPKSRFGEALGYLRNHWEAFQLYLQDGRLPIDNNDVERDHRRIAIGRKNWLFLGSEDAGDRTATILTIVGSAHRHDLDVWAYLRDVLERLARGTTDLEALLPDVWKAAHPEHVRTFREQEKQERADARRYQRARRRQQR
jgi:transposase